MNDSEILKSIKASKNEGTELLFCEYHKLVKYIVEAKLSGIASSSDVEECVNSVFMDFVLSIDKVDERVGIKPYLCAIARNKSISTYRVLSSQSEVLSIDESLSSMNTSLPDDEVIEAEDRRRLVDEIAALGYPDREIIVYKYYFCLSSKVIAEKLSISAGAVDVRCHRALKKLKKRLGGSK